MNKSKKQKSKFDGIGQKVAQDDFFDLPLSRFVLKHKKTSVLLSRKGKTESFFTRDSKLYYTPEELKLLQKGGQVTRITRRFDGLSSRDFEKSRIYAIGREEFYYAELRAKYLDFGSYVADWVRGKTEGISMVRMWNVSIVSAVIFGMVMMTMIYRYLGQNVSAQVAGKRQAAIEQERGLVLGMEEEQNGGEDIDAETITNLFREYEKAESEEARQAELEKEIREMVKGYPIEKMAGEIAKQDRIVAAFLVAIAKKESGWGKHVPVYQGQDCFNLWGYRGIRDKMGTGGHTCFNSPEDAVATVAKRINFLVSSEKLNTPEKLKVWKCGYDCSWDDPQAVRKWIMDVDKYFRKLNKV